MEISVVSPIYKGEKMLDELVRRVGVAVSKITEDYEIILVNDASPDNSWKKIKELCAKDKRIKGINLSRNFGQPYAVTAGLSKTQGDWIVVMDCDLQDRPEDIPLLYKKAKAGYDVVLAKRNKQKDSFCKRLSSIAFHSVYDFLSGMHTDSSIGNFGIYCKSIIYEYVKIPEYARSFSVLIGTLGYSKSYIDVFHDERGEGSSSYTLIKLLKLSSNVILANSNKPLHLAVGIGFLMAFISFILAIYNVIARLCGLIDVPGYTFTIFSIWFVGGLLLLMMGVLGIYVGKIFDQVKGRPYYIIKESLNTDDEAK